MAAREFFLGFPSVSDFIVNLFRCCLPGMRGSKNADVTKENEKLVKTEEESKGEDK